MAKFTGIPNPNTVVETPHPPARNRVLWPYTPKCERVSHPLYNLQKSILWKEGHWLNQIPLSWYINLVIGLGSRDFETHSPLIVRHKVLSKPWSTLQTAATSTWQRRLFSCCPLTRARHTAAWGPDTASCLGLVWFGLTALELRVTFLSLFLTQSF